MKKQELVTIVFCKYLKILLFFIYFLNSSIPTISRLQNNKYCFAKTQISTLLITYYSQSLQNVFHNSKYSVLVFQIINYGNSQTLQSLTVSFARFC